MFKSRFEELGINFFTGSRDVAMNEDWCRKKWIGHLTYSFLQFIREDRWI
jgi:hypothetical protein